jgi:hypothetical protein
VAQVISSMRMHRFYCGRAVRITTSEPRLPVSVGGFLRNPLCRHPSHCQNPMPRSTDTSVSINAHPRRQSLPSRHSMAPSSFGIADKFGPCDERPQILCRNSGIGWPGRVLCTGRVAPATRGRAVPDQSRGQRPSGPPPVSHRKCTGPECHNPHRVS